MFDMENRPTVVKSVVESADSGIESADSIADSAIIPLKIGLWVWALSNDINSACAPVHPQVTSPLRQLSHPFSKTSSSTPLRRYVQPKICIDLES